MNDLGLVTIEEFIQQVWDVDGVKVEIKVPSYPNRLVRPYKYERLPGTATVDDINARIHECLEPFIYIIKL